MSHVTSSPNFQELTEQIKRISVCLFVFLREILHLLLLSSACLCFFHQTEAIKVGCVGLKGNFQHEWDNVSSFITLHLCSHFHPSLRLGVFFFI